MTKLYILNGPDVGGVVDLDAETFNIGRSPENDIQWQDKSISRRHAKIIVLEDKYYIMDLKSTNGTSVNTMRLIPGIEVEVEKGTPVGVGKVFFSIDVPFEGDLEAIQDSIEEPKDTTERISIADKDRPLTLQKNLGLLQKVSQVLMESLNIQEILEKILDAIFDLFDRIDRGLIILLDSESGKILDIITSDKQSSEDTVMLYSRTIVDRVITEREPVMSADTVNEEDFELSDSMEMMQICSVMCVPMISRNKIRGVIYIDSIKRPFGFRKDDLTLLTALSSPAAVAIENALLHASLEEAK